MEKKTSDTLFTIGMIAFLGLILWKGIRSGHGTHGNMIGTAVPQFSLTTLNESQPNFTDLDLHSKISIVHVFGSWCYYCRMESGILKYIHEHSDIPIYGIAMNDDRNEVNKMLEEGGNPYEKVGMDNDGAVSMDLGIHGTPDTYVVDQHGVIQGKFDGQLSQTRWEQEVLPKIKELQANDAHS